MVPPSPSIDFDARNGVILHKFAGSFHAQLDLLRDFLGGEEHIDV
jgi:hypothetical protein